MLIKIRATKQADVLKFFFQINLHKKDNILLEQIKNFFNVGKIYDYDTVSSRYLITSVKDLQTIRKHFNEYQLHTQKRAYFEFWKQALSLV